MGPWGFQAVSGGVQVTTQGLWDAQVGDTASIMFSAFEAPIKTAAHAFWSLSVLLSSFFLHVRVLMKLFMQLS